MSSRDDDIGELIEKINELIEVLTVGVSAEQQEQQTGVSGEVEGDLYAVGETSKLVNSFEEYIIERRKAADSRDISLPKVRIDSTQTDKFFAKLYLQGAENLNAVHKQLSKGQWKNFVQIISTRLIKKASEEITNQEMREKFATPAPDDLRKNMENIDLFIDIIDPGPSFFGIMYNERDEDINILDTTPFLFMRVYGSVWNAEFIDDVANIRDELAIEETPDEVDFIGAGTNLASFVIDTKEKAIERLKENIRNDRNVKKSEELLEEINKLPETFREVTIEEEETVIEEDEFGFGEEEFDFK